MHPIIFNYLSYGGFQLRVESDSCFAFALFRSLIGSIRSKNQTNRDLLARIFRAWRQIHVLASSSTAIMKRV